MPEPEVTFALNIDGKHKLRVHVWATVGQLRDERKRLGGKGNRSAYGFFDSDHYAIHLAKNSIGWQTFPHELQHFIQLWQVTYKWDGLGKHSEAIADLAGSLTEQFWKQLLKRYTVSMRNA